MKIELCDPKEMGIDCMVFVRKHYIKERLPLPEMGSLSKSERLCYSVVLYFTGSIAGNMKGMDKVWKTHAWQSHKGRLRKRCLTHFLLVPPNLAAWSVG